MATVAQFDQDQDPSQQQQNSSGGGQVLNSTGGGGATGVTSGIQGASTSPTRSTPSGAPNIQQYLQANQGAGQNLANGIQNSAQTQSDNINQGVNTASSNLSGQYQLLSQNLGQNAQSTIQTAFQNPQNLLDAYNTAKTNSSSQPLTDDQQTNLNQYNQFQQLNNGGYANDIQNYGSTAAQANSNAQNQYANLAQQANNSKTESGRFQLLQNLIGQPNYNSGQQTLDGLFLQSQPGVANQLQQNLGNIANQTGQNVQNFNQDAQSKLAALQSLSSQDQQQIKNQFGSALGNINTNVQNEYTNAQQQSATEQAGLATGAKNATGLTADQISQLGLTAGTHTYGLNDLTPYLTNNTLTNVAQTATPEEFARYNALNQLAGGPAGTLQSSIFGSATSAGGYNPISFDTSRFNTDVKAQQDEVNKTAFNGALTNALTNFGYVAPHGTSFGAPAQGGQDSAPLINSLAAGLQAGTLTPDQANQMIGQYQQHIAGYNPLDVQDFNQAINPFTDYYKNTYLPANSATIGKA